MNEPSTREAAKRTSIEDICLADYGELDAAERDLLLALIQSTASGLDAAADASSPAKDAMLPPVQGAFPLVLRSCAPLERVCL